jgi:hypothetical protein
MEKLLAISFQLLSLTVQSAFVSELKVRERQKLKADG